MATFRKPYIQIATPLDYLNSGVKENLQYGSIPIYYNMGTIYGDELIKETSNYGYQIDNDEVIPLTSNEGWILATVNGSYTFYHDADAVSLDGDGNGTYERSIDITGITEGYPELPFVIGMKDLNTFNPYMIDMVDKWDVGKGNQYEANFLILQPTLGEDEEIEERVYTKFYPDYKVNDFIEEEDNINYKSYSIYENYKFTEVARRRESGMYYLLIERTNAEGYTCVYYRDFYVSDGVGYTFVNGNKPSEVDYEPSSKLSMEMVITDPDLSLVAEEPEALGSGVTLDDVNYDIDNVKVTIVDPNNDPRPNPFTSMFGGIQLFSFDDNKISYYYRNSGNNILKYSGFEVVSEYKGPSECKYFTSNIDDDRIYAWYDNSIIVIESKTMNRIGSVNIDPRTKGVVYNEKTNCLYTYTPSMITMYRTMDMEMLLKVRVINGIMDIYPFENKLFVTNRNFLNEIYDAERLVLSEFAIRTPRLMSSLSMRMDNPVAEVKHEVYVPYDSAERPGEERILEVLSNINDGDLSVQRATMVNGSTLFAVDTCPEGETIDGVYDDVTINGTKYNLVDGSFTFPINENILYKIDFDSYKMNNDGEFIWIKHHTVFGEVNWVQDDTVPVAPRFLTPINGEENIVEPIVRLEAMDSCIDFLTAINTDNGEIIELEPVDIVEYHPFVKDIVEYEPPLSAKGNYILSLSRTELNAEGEIISEGLYTHHVNVIEAGSIAIEYTNINNGAVYTGKVTPSVRFTFNDEPLNEEQLRFVEINSSYTREYNGTETSNDCVLDYEGIDHLGQPSSFSLSGFYTVNTRVSLPDATDPSGYITSEKSVTFQIDTEYPELPFIIGIQDGASGESFTWRVRKPPYTNISITLSSLSYGWNMTPKYSIIYDEFGDTYYEGTILEEGIYRMVAAATKITNGFTSSYTVNSFEVYTVSDAIKRIKLSIPDDAKGTERARGDLCYAKSMVVNFDEGVAANNPIRSYDNASIYFYDIPGVYNTFDKTWDPYSEHIVYPGSNSLTPTVPYATWYTVKGAPYYMIDGSKPGERSLLVERYDTEWIGPEGSGWGYWPEASENPLFSEWSQLRGVHHTVPDKPLLSVNYFDGGATITINNWSADYRYICRLDGRLVTLNGKTYTTHEEGRHNFHCVCTDLVSYRESNSDIELQVCKRKPIPAPCIAVNRSCKAFEGTDIKLEIYFHPFTDEFKYNVRYAYNKTDIRSIDYNFSQDNTSQHSTANRKGLKTEYHVYDNCVVRADGTPSRPVFDRDGSITGEYEKDYENDCRRLSKCCTNVSVTSCGRTWASRYKELVDLERYWNIELYWYEDWQNLNIGKEYRTVDTIVYESTPEFNNFIKPPEITGLYPKTTIRNSEDNRVQYSAYPHTKRYLNHNYFSYLNGEPYELGECTDNLEKNVSKNNHIDIGVEFRKYGIVKRLNKHDAKFFNVDTLYPPYPKLSKDVESIMTEPFQINVINESVNNENIVYTAVLKSVETRPVFNKETQDYDINVIHHTVDNWGLGDYIWEDGDYILDVYAYRVMNRTFRHRSFYFTLDTFQQIPTKPLKAKVIPRDLDGVEEAVEREFLADKHTGHYGVIRDGELHVPTMEIEENLIEAEKIITNTSKIYNDSQDCIEDLFDRYNVNRETMEALFNKAIKSKELNDDIKERYEKLRLENVTNDAKIQRDEIAALALVLDEALRLAYDVIDSANYLLDGMNEDRSTMIFIIRRHIFDAFGELRYLEQKNDYVRAMLQTKKTKAQLATWKDNELKKFNDYRSTVLSRYNSWVEAVDIAKTPPTK